MILASEGLAAITTPQQHEALYNLLAKSFGHHAAPEVLDSMLGMRQYFSFHKGVPVAVLSVRSKGTLQCAKRPLANVIYNAATAPRHRRKGHMRKLLQRVIADYHQQGKRHLNLEVLRNNHKAARLYTSVGFHVVNTCGDIALMRLLLR